MSIAVPSWREVHKAIPPDFRDNGPSSPVQGLYGVIYWGRVRRADIAQAARGHDYGYGPGRLPGSPFAHITRPGWDLMYATHLCDRGHEHIARIHHQALAWFGAWAWDRSLRRMHGWGWFTYEDFLRDVDKTYTPAPGGGVM